MSGIFIKELYILRRMLKSYLIVILIYGGLSLTRMLTIYLFAGILTMLMAVLPMNLFAWDNAARWDGYCMALPVSRRQVVAARYLVMLLTLALSFGLSLLLGAALMATGQMQDPFTYVTTTASCLATGILVNIILLPILYKVGPEKGRIAMMGVFGAIFIAIFALAKLGAFDPLDAMPQPTMAGLLAVGLVVVGFLLVLSFLLSCRFYQRKEA